MTPDILGPVQNGGVGTAYAEIAAALAANGHSVTIFFLPITGTEVKDFELHQQNYLSQGIALLRGAVPTVRTECLLPMRRAYAVYEQLRRYSFDFIHFPDMGGLGYFCFLAKKMGLAFAGTTLVTNVHGPNSWHREFNDEELSSQDEVAIDFLERRSVELADHVTAPHHSILSWLKAREVKVPESKFILPLPCDSVTVPMGSGMHPRLIRELVFFGRLETRKGLEIFCDALDRLVERGLDQFRVSFLGKAGTVAGQGAFEYLQRRSARWSFPFEIETGLGREAALETLRGPGRLAIFPSRAETYGLALEECLRQGTPILAAPLEVFRDRVAEESRDATFFDGTPEGLAENITAILNEGARPAIRQPEPMPPSQAWTDWHNRAPERLKSERSQSAPLVSVCLTHRNRPELLEQALDSLRAQTYRNFEVILSDDGSDSPVALSYLRSLESEFERAGWKIIYHPCRSSPGASRNRAVKAARGEYVLLMDDDNLAKPQELATFVQAAAHTDADVLTCFFDRIPARASLANLQVQSRWLCLGDDLASGFLSNVFGDMNALIRRGAYLRLGGVSELEDVGCEDWEFFIRATAAGLKLLVVPEALFYYREQEGSYSSRVDRFRTRLLPRSAYSRLSPEASLAPLYSYMGGRFSGPVSSAKVSHCSTDEPILGEVNGGDLFAWHERFTEVLFSLESEKSAGEIVPIKEIQLRSNAEGLLIEAEGSDPAAELTGLGLEGRHRLVVEAEITSEVATDFQLFFLSSGNSEYEEEKSIRRRLVPGVNKVWFLVEAPNLRGALRIDPSQAPGKYELRRFEIRGEL